MEDRMEDKGFKQVVGVGVRCEWPGGGGVYNEGVEGGGGMLTETLYYRDDASYTLPMQCLSGLHLSLLLGGTAVWSLFTPRVDWHAP